MTLQSDLKRTVEAASGGKQTVLFTPSGQPTFVNVLKRADFKASDDPLLVAIGVTSGDHPAFKVGSRTLDKIYVGTYPTTLVNDELVSQPYNAATGISNISETSAGLPTWVANTGLNAHVATVAELNLLKSLVRKSGFNPYGNDEFKGASLVNPTQKGVRVDGLAVGSANTTTTTTVGAQLSGAILTGSGTVGFRTENTPTGISDLGAGYVTPIRGVRIIKGEVQVYANPTLKNTADNAEGNYSLSVLANSDNPNFMTNWYAIDATTGELKTPTFTGGLLVGGSNTDSRSYTVTTVNSVKLTTATTSSGGYYSVGNLAFDGSLPAKVVAFLRYLGLINEQPADVASPTPAKRGSFVIPTNGLAFSAWGASGLFESRIDPQPTTISNPRMFYYN